ncbi:MAG: YkvA family protein [Pedococcus sp.]
MAVNRLGAFRTIATALRTALRPGSPGLGERFASVPRLLRSTLRGDYHGSTRGRLFMIAAAVAYVVSPIDLVPEAFLSVLGLADDAVVVSWLAAAFINETETYLRWERTVQGSAPADGYAGASGSGASRAQGQTVPGHVVR